MRKTNKKKINIPLCAAAVLLCLAMLSISMTSGLYAKYTTSSTGSDSARVAKFAMETAVTSQSSHIELKAGDAGSSGSYTFTVKNTSEVLVKYSVIVKNVPNRVKVVLNNTEKTATGNEDLTFDAGQLAIGDTKACTLTFSALDGSTTQKIPVTVQVHAEQVD